MIKQPIPSMRVVDATSPCRIEGNHRTHTSNTKRYHKIDCILACIVIRWNHGEHTRHRVLLLVLLCCFALGDRPWTGFQVESEIDIEVSSNEDRQPWNEELVIPVQLHEESRDQEHLFLSGLAVVATMVAHQQEPDIR